MRLWHTDLIDILDNKRLLSQHRECCMFRGNAYEKGNYPGYQLKAGWDHLIAYHFLVIKEMEKRNYNVDPLWYDYKYRGKNCEPWKDIPKNAVENIASFIRFPQKIMPQTMTSDYFLSCINTIKSRGGNLIN